MPTYRIYERQVSFLYPVIRITELVSVFGCLVLLVFLTDSFVWPRFLDRLSYISVGAFMLILLVDGGTHLLGRPVPIPQIMMYLLVGVLLFFTCGVMAALKIARPFHGSLIAFTVVCLLTAFLMLCDILVTLYLEYKKAVYMDEEYYFDPVQKNMENGDIILHLVNPKRIGSEQPPTKDDMVMRSNVKPVKATDSNVKQPKLIESRLKINESKTKVAQLEGSKTDKPHYLIGYGSRSADRLQADDSLLTNKQIPIHTPPQPHKSGRDDKMLTEAGRLMRRRSQDMIVKDVRTSQLHLTESTEINSMNGTFYMVRPKSPAGPSTARR